MTAQWIQFLFGMMKTFWKQRWQLHNIQDVLNATELYTLKWSVFMLCEFYLNKNNEKYNFIGRS